MSAPVDKASGKLWDGATEAQAVFGDLDGHRPALLGVYEAVSDATAYRAELSVRVDEPVLSDDLILQHDLRLPDTWWADLAGTLEKVEAVYTDRVAVRQQYMERVIPEFVGIPAPAVSCRTTAQADVHWANLTSPLRLLDREGWGRAPEGFDAATLYAYSLLQPDTATLVRTAFPILGCPAARLPGCPAARQASPPKRPCAPRCSKPWPAVTTRSWKTGSGTGLRNCATVESPLYAQIGDLDFVRAVVVVGPGQRDALRGLLASGVVGGLCQGVRRG
ncbi:hypothetical protein [Streptomyces sp. NPDC059371]|uniref:hypothetical protein n=1 Tax=Streptomyces sp. NPDC059371 TaxID=3346812 RepID=UPI00368F98F2